MIWATVSSWSCFCWLYRASPSLAAKNTINLISVLTIWWCPCVEPCVVGRGCLLWPVHFLGKTLLVFALLHSVFQGQICLLFQVFLFFFLVFYFLNFKIFNSYMRSQLGFLWREWCWSWNSNTLATWCEVLTHLKRPWCWERLKVGGELDDRGWDGWMASPTQWTWVWVNSESWWWTGRPGVLQSLGSQKVGQDWAAELNWTEQDTLG